MSLAGGSRPDATATAPDAGPSDGGPSDGSRSDTVATAVEVAPDERPTGWRRVVRRPDGSRRRFPAGWSLASYLIGSLILYSGMLANPAARTIKAGADDPAQSMWFLAWLPNAVLHGRDPFHTDFVHYPDGVNLMWNAFAPLLAALAAPITLTAGPVAAFNVLLVVGMGTGAWTSRLWIGRYVEHPVAAWVGGAALGFCPFVIGHGSVHIGLMIITFLPLIVMGVEDLLWRRPRPARRTGLWLGAAVAGQVLINEEMILLLLIGLGVALLISLLMRPGRTLRAFLASIPGVLWALLSFAVIAGYPLYRQLGDKKRLSTVNAEWWSAQPRDWVFPTQQRLLNRGPETAYWANRQIGDWEAVGYLGGLLIALLLAIIVWRWRKEYAVRVAAIFVPLTMVLALGSRLRLGKHYHGTKYLPWHFVQQVPLLHFVLPIRVALVTSMAVALLVAIGLDRVLRRGRWPRVLGVAVIVVALVPLVPDREKAGTPVGVPAFFTGSAARSIPWGSSTMILPIALPPYRQWSMLWSAEAGARFRDIGGAAKRPGLNNAATPFPESNPLTIWATEVSAGQHPTEIDTNTAADWLHANKVQYVLVADDYTLPDTPVQVTNLVGSLPYLHSGGVRVWKVEKCPNCAAPANGD